MLEVTASPEAHAVDPRLDLVLADIVQAAAKLQNSAGGPAILDQFGTEEVLQVVSRHALNARGDLFHVGEASPLVRELLVDVAAQALLALLSWQRRNRGVRA
jgi:hypothetical protein